METLILVLNACQLAVQLASIAIFAAVILSR